MPNVSRWKPIVDRWSLSCLNIFMVSDSVDFWRQASPNREQNARPFNVFTREIATNDRPAEKSTWPSSMTASSRVRPWLLWIVIPQAMVRGSCVCDSSFPDLFSQRATDDGTMGTQDGSIPSHPGLSGPTANIITTVWDFQSQNYHTCIPIKLNKNNCWEVTAWIWALMKPNLFNNSLSTIYKT